MGILSSEQSLWSEIWEYLLYRYFNPRLPYFDNISNRLEAWTVVIVIACVFVGIMAAGVFLVIYKRVLGDLPSTLAELGATSEDTAVIPNEAGIKIPLLLRLSLRRSTSPLRRYIRYVGQKDLTYDEQLAIDKSKSKVKGVAPDFREVPIYLISDRSEECLRRFARNGSDGKSAAILIALSVVLFFVICRFLPDLMALVDTLLGLYK